MTRGTELFHLDKLRQFGELKFFLRNVYSVYSVSFLLREVLPVFKQSHDQK